MNIFLQWHVINELVPPQSLGRMRFARGSARPFSGAHACEHTAFAFWIIFVEYRPLVLRLHRLLMLPLFLKCRTSDSQHCFVNVVGAATKHNPVILTRVLQREAYYGSDGVEREPSAFGPFIIKRYMRPLADNGSRCVDFSTLLDIAEATSSGGPYYMKESLLNSVRASLSRGSVRAMRRVELLVGREKPGTDCGVS